MNSLPYTLNAEQTALFQEMQDSALFPALATPGEGELVTLFKKSYRELQRKRLEPCADLLKTHILARVCVDRAAILEELKKDPKAGMRAELFSWHTIRYNQTLTQLQKAQSKMSFDEKTASRIDMHTEKQQIKDNHWETMLRVDEITDSCEMMTAMWEVKINDIFRFTDIADRVALALGPCFFPYIQWQEAEDLTNLKSPNFRIYKKALCVRYYPFGLDLPKMKRLFEAASKQNERALRGEIRFQEHFELVVLSPPALPLYHHCFCCRDDDEHDA